VTREGSSSPFLVPKPEIAISLCIGRLMVEERLRRGTPNTGQSQLFIGRVSGKLPRNPMV